MPRGQVKWFDPKKGFGFIIGPEGQDVFVHYSHIQSEGFRTLKDGEQVDYELVQGEKGWQARNVAAVNSAHASGSPAAESKPPQGQGGAGYEGGSAAPSGYRSSGYEGAS